MNNFTRRNFLFVSSGATIGTFLVPGLAEASEKKDPPKSGLATGKPILLRYSSIPGFLSAEQMKPHYEAHYGSALRGYISADEKLQSGIIAGAKMDSNAYGAIQRARASKGNSVVLHELYFDALALKTNDAKAEVRKAIEKRFGSIDKWAGDFIASAKAAKGWAI